ncbi:hypothetical protein DW828_17325, partial [Parabacteroides merdae]
FFCLIVKQMSEQVLTITNKESDMIDIGPVTNAGLVAQHRFPYDHNASLDANLQTVNEKLNNMEEYREELQEAEYSGGMRR